MNHYHAGEPEPGSGREEDALKHVLLTFVQIEPLIHESLQRLQGALALLDSDEMIAKLRSVHRLDGE